MGFHTEILVTQNNQFFKYIYVKEKKYASLVKITQKLQFLSWKQQARTVNALERSDVVINFTDTLSGLRGLD